ncbi:MAG TPA: PKD domain-containing protein [Pirellulales bacterium]|nr:PKD domain-containing protein [Pirellulales bacterium]
MFSLRAWLRRLFLGTSGLARSVRLRHGRRGGSWFSFGRGPRRHRNGDLYRQSASWPFERLEPIALLSADNWTGTAGDGLWTTVGNWDNGVPTSTSDVVIGGGSAVTFHTNAQTLAAKTITLSGGASLDYNSANVPIIGQVTVGAGSTLTIEGGGGLRINPGAATPALLLDGTVSLGTAASGGSLTFDGNQTIAPDAGHTGTIVMAANNETLDLSSGSTLTIGSGITIAGGSGHIGSPSTALNNQGIINANTANGTFPGLNVALGTGSNFGTIKATVSGANLTVDGTNWTNAASGVISAVSGATLSLDNAAPTSDTWVNSGLIQVNHSTVNIGGKITQASLGTTYVSGAPQTAPAFVRDANSTVNLTGEIDGSLSLGVATTGPWFMLGGKLNGGAFSIENTIPGLDGLIATTFGGTLNAVTLNSPVDLTINNNASLTISGGLTLNTTWQVGNTTGTTAASLQFRASPSQTLSTSGGGEILLEPNSSNQLSIPAGSLTIGAGVAVVAHGGFIGGSGGLTNQGTITADAANQTVQVQLGTGQNQSIIQGINGPRLTIYGSNWTNASSGTISISGGGTLSLDNSITDTWTNNGLIQSTFSVVNLNGTFTQASLGAAYVSSSAQAAPAFVRDASSAVNLTGKISGNLALSSTTTGSWNLVSGTLSNGTFSTDGFASLIVNSQGTLSNMTLNSPLDLQSHSSSLTIQNNLQLNATLIVGTQTAASQLFFSAPGNSQTLSGSGQIVLFPNSSNEVAVQSGSLTSSVTIVAGGGFIGGGTSMTNQGTITANGGQNVNVQLGPGQNQGTIQAINGGSLTVTSSGNFSAGTLTGGTWKAVSGGVLRLSGDNIVTNAASIVLDGNTSHIYNASSGTTDALAGLTTNAAAGSLTVNNGYSLTPAGGTLANAGLLAGNATINGGVSNSGTVAPGGIRQTGTLTIQGSYSQSGTGALDIDIAGTTFGSFDRIVAQTANLGGTLSPTALSGFQSARGNTYYVITAAAGVSGSFASIGNPGFASGDILAPKVASTAFGLLDLPAGTTTYWVGPGSGNWSTAGNWSTGVAPASTDSVYIGSPYSVTFDTGGPVHSLFLDGSLDVAGSLNNLTVTNGLTVNGTLTGSGTIVGDVTNSGTFTPGGDGTVGTINIQGNYTQTPSGTLKIDIGGGFAGGFDQMNVTGTTNSGGMLDVQATGGFSPPLGQFFDVVTAASFNGEFPTVNTSLSGGNSLTPYYLANYEPSGANALVLSLNPAGTTDYWTNPAGGDWNAAGNWSNGVPTSHDNALINVPALSGTVLISGGENVSVQSLTVGSAPGFNTLAIEGDSTLSIDQGVGTALSGDATIALGVDPTSWGKILFDGTAVSVEGVTITFGINSSNQIAIDPTGAGDSVLFLDATLNGIEGELTAGAASDAIINDADSSITSDFGLVIDPAGTFTNHGAVIVSGGSLVVSPQGGITNFANGVLTGGTWEVDAGTLELTGDDIRTNDATINLGGGQLTVNAAGDSALANLDDNDVQGSLNINSDTFTTNAFNFTNAGTVTIGPGVTFVAPAGFTYTQVSGTTAIENGTLDGAAGGGGAGAGSGNGNVVINGGRITGPGTIADNLTINGGTFAPNGVVAINGNYTQHSGGTLSLLLRGTADGQFDQVTVDGVATLGGTLNVLDDEGFSPPADGSLYPVFESGPLGSISGDFAVKNTRLANGAFLATYYGATGMTLGVVPVGTTDYWINPAGGDWSNPSNWSTGAVPTTTDHVFIGVPGAPTITVANGESGDVASLALATDTLQVDGTVGVTNFELLSGTLSGAGSATLLSTATIRGGTLATASLTNEGTVTIDGDVTLATTLVNNNQITQTGGTVFFADGEIDNFGNYDFAADDPSGQASWVSESGTNTFLNVVDGVLGKTAGTGTTSIAAALSVAPLTIDNQDEVDVDAGTLDLSGATVAQLSGNVLSGGYWYVNNATLTLGAVITSNAAHISLSGAAASFPDVDGLTTNSGGLQVDTGLTLMGPSLTNTGYVSVGAGGELVVLSPSGHGVYSQTAGETYMSGGTLHATGGVVLSGGTLDGYGTIEGNVTNSATVEQDGGALNLKGNYTQMSTGALVLTLFDTSQGEPQPGGYGQLDVTGNAAIQGQVSVHTSFIATLAAGATFQPLVFGSSSGLAGALSLPSGFSSLVTNTSLLLFNGAAPTVFTVTNTSGDFSVSGSLGDAIQQADLAGGGIIEFDLPAGSVIRPNTSLPVIAVPIVIDGTSATNYGGTPAIEIDGTNAAAGANGLSISAPNTLITGLSIVNFGGAGIDLSGVAARYDVIEGNWIGVSLASAAAPNNTGILIENNATQNLIGGPLLAATNVISGNAFDGIDISSASQNYVEGNIIGLDPAAATAIPNGSRGINMFGASTGNFVGITEASRAANVIAGNLGDGVDINGTGTNGNVVNGNFIGTNAAGVAGLGNQNGVAIYGGAQNNTVNQGNVVSGNNASGVSISGPGTTGNEVKGNLIGTDPTGTLALGNAFDGVAINNGASSNTIGGGAGDGNTISGNHFGGITISDGGTSQNVVEGNFIGTDVSGANALGNALDGVTIASGASNNTVGGPIAGFGNVISGNLDGVYLTGIGTSGNTVEGNLIGTNAAGTAAVANMGSGVHIAVGASDNTIGGPISDARNVISGNSGAGVYISDNGTMGNMVEGNYIGTNAAGERAIANGGSGVQIVGGANNNTIGGSDPSDGNLISGNNFDGIYLGGAGTTQNTIANNLIGTNATGSSIVFNTSSGVFLDRGADHTTIGPGNVIMGLTDGLDITSNSNSVLGNKIGTNAAGDAPLGIYEGGIGIELHGSDNTIGDPAQGNLISGNSDGGIYLSGSSANDNQIVGNTIGTDATGSFPIPNGSGIYITGGANTNDIGLPGEGNLISGNNGDGVVISNPGTNSNSVVGNLIGTNAAGTAAVGNQGNGLDIYGGADANTVGGFGEENVLSGNDGYGIRVDGFTASGNHVFANYVGTEAGGMGTLTNASGALSVTDGAYVYLAGSFTGNVLDDGTVDLDGNNVAVTGAFTGSGTATNNGAGTPTLSVDGTGTFDGDIVEGEGSALAFAVTGGTVGLSGDNFYSGGTTITAGTLLVTGTAGGPVTIAAGGTLNDQVINTQDSGLGTLRQAIDNANLASGAGANLITFDIPTSDPGYQVGTGTWTITPNYTNAGSGVSLPVVTSPVVLDGWSQGGASYSGSPLIELDGVNAHEATLGSFGLNIQAPNVMVRGFDIVNYPLESGGNGFGIGVFSPNATNDWIYGNYIGLDPTGEFAEPNGQGGIWVGSGASNVVIGTNADGVNDSAERNVISGNHGNGILVQGSHVTIAGNYIGLDATGGTALPNQVVGIYLDSTAQGSVVGGTVAGAGNVISGNAGNGVTLAGPLLASGAADLWHGDASGADSVGANNATVDSDVTYSQGRVGQAFTFPGATVTDGSQDVVDFGPNAGNFGTSDFTVQFWIQTTSTAARQVVLNKRDTTFDGSFWSIELLNGVPHVELDQDSASDNYNAFAAAVTVNDGHWHLLTLVRQGTTAVLYIDGIERGHGTTAGITNISNTGDMRSGTYVPGNPFLGASTYFVGRLDEISIFNRALQPVEIQPEIGAANNTVAGNYIGTNSTGSSAVANGGSGVEVFGAGNTIGGDTVAARNILSGNALTGVLLTGSGATSNKVQGNYIGTDVSGTQGLGNGSSGVAIQGGATGNVIGTDGDGVNDQTEGNLISGNGFGGDVGFGTDGVNIQSGDNIVAGNFIGTNYTGLVPLANHASAVAVRGGTGNRIGVDGTDPGAAAEGNVLAGSGTFGVYLDSNSTNTVIAGNKIGVGADGTTRVANGVDGIYVDTTIGTRIGTNADGINDDLERNVVSGNAVDGIDLTANGSGTVIAGNYIGTDATGMVALANGGNGITINGGHNVIGGGLPGAGNLISGNATNGVLIGGSSATGNVLAGNYIGVNAAGSTALPNSGNTLTTAGVIVNGGANHNFIGTNGDGVNDASEGNVISGNTGGGVFITGAGTNSNVVAGNFIGLDSTGTYAIANHRGGVRIRAGAQYNLVGTNADGISDSDERNVVSGNVSFDGVSISGAGTNYNVVAGNYLGTDATGLHAVPNFDSGVSITTGAAFNRIGTDGLKGGLDIEEGNLISGNHLDGMYLEDAVDNVIAGNDIGTDETGAAALPNGATGIILTTDVSGSQGNRIGTNSDGQGDADERNVISGNATDGILITGSGTGSNTVAGNYIGTNAAGTAALANAGNGVNVSGTATNTIGGTNIAARNVIGGNLAQGVLVTGAAATGNKIAGDYIGTNAAGTAAVPNRGGDGVRLASGANDNTVGGTTAGAGNVLSGNLGVGVRITGAGSNSNTVAGNEIGTNAAGTAALANGNSGVLIDSGAQSNTIGGASAAARNVISGNALAGVAFQSSGTTGNTVEGNWVGLNAAGTGGLANVQTGIAFVDSSSGNSALDNVVSGNQLAGVYVGGSLQTPPGSSNNIIRGNLIGTTPGGTTPLGNSGPGVWIQNGSTGNVVGGTAAGQANVIAFNSQSGVKIAGSTTTGNASRANSIYANGNLGIELANGGNSNQPYPVITTVTFGNQGGSPVTTIVGTLHAAPNTTYVVDFYANPAADPSGYGQGESYLGSITLGTDSNGAGSFNDAILYDGTALANGGKQQVFSATATDPAGNTSQFALDAPTPSISVAIHAPATSSEGLSLELTSSVTDTNAGATYTYNWNVTTPTGSVLSLGGAANQPSLQLDPVNIGTYTVTLTVTDSLGNAAQATALIKVTAPAPAVVIQGSPSGPAPGTGVVGTPISLTGTLVAPAGDTISAYGWSVSKNGQPYSLPAGTITNQADFTFTPGAPGSYVVQLLATDANGGTATAIDDVLVTTATPVAQITQVPAVAVEGTPITLANAITSGSLTGTLTYVWSVTKNGAAYDPGAPTNQPTFTFTPNDEGTYQISLSVTDGTTSGIAPPVVIQVKDAPLTATITDATTGHAPAGNVLAGTSISLRGAAGTPDTIDAPSLSWAVTDSAGEAIAGGSGATFGFTPHQMGLYIVTLTATDSTQTANSSVAFNVGAPAIGVVLATSGSLTEGGQVTVQATATPPNAYSYAWTVTDESAPVSVGTTTSGGGSAVMFSPPTAGSYLVSVTVNNGTVGVTTSTVVNVVNEAPSAPTITVAAGGTVLAPNPSVPEGTLLNLSAASADPGGSFDTLTYVWQIIGPEGFTQTTGGPTFNFTPIESGQYSVTATATDSNGATATSNITIGVTHVQPTPTIEVGSVTVGAAGDTTVNMRAAVPDPGNDDQFDYFWTAFNPQGGTVATTSGFGLASFSFTESAGKPGIYTVRVRVTDDDGGDQTTTAPIVSAGDNQTITLQTTGGMTTVSVDGATVTTVSSGQGMQVVVVATGAGVTIDGSGASVSLVEAALGSHDTLMGGSGNNVLQGDSGFNSLMGGSGPNTLYASTGDTLLGGNGNNANLFQVLTSPSVPASNGPISITAGNHDNTLSFAQSSLPVTVNLASNGTQQIDANDQLQLSGQFQNLMGSSGADMLFAAPNSTVYGGGGNDSLLAAGGSNIGLVSGSLAGQAAKLEVDGAKGAMLFGGTGNDSMIASGGTSVSMYAGSGNSSLSATGGASISMQAGGGQSSLYASGGSSITMFGGTGNDSLSSTGGMSVSMYTGGGGDTLPHSGSSSISLFGGGGYDTMAASGGTSISMYAGGGNESLSATGGTSVSMHAGGGNSSLYASGGSGVTMFGGTGNDSLSTSGGTSVSMMAGTGGTTIFPSGSSSISLFGGTGNETLSASGGTSISLYGGSGNDSLSTTGGTSVSIQAGSGNNSLYSSDGSSISLFGGTGNDSLISTGGTSVSMYAGSGNTSLHSSGGSSITMFGGTGNDSLVSTGGTSVSMYAGSGNTSLHNSGGSSITMFGGTGNDSLTSTGGTSVSMYGGSGNATLSSTGGTTVSMVGGAGNSSLYSSGGSSVTMFGGTGNDSLGSTGGTSVSMYGGSGNATLSSTGGTTVTMVGGTGNSSLYNSGGSSITMFGGTGNDTMQTSGGTSVSMYGGSGNSSLSASGSSYTMTTSGGTQTLYTSGGSSITMFGGSGNDTLTSTGGTSVSMYGGSGNSSLSSTGGTAVTMVGGTGNSTLYTSGGSSITMFGGTGNDTMQTSGGTSVSMYAGSGNSSVHSSGGSSITMFGGTGNDSLSSTGGTSVSMYGGSGNSSLSSTGGTAVTMVGGTGNSTLYNSGGSSVTMFGGTGNDSLNTSGGTSVSMYGGSGNSSLSASGSTSSTLVGGTGNSSLHNSGGSSITMFGGTGNDTLDNTAGTFISLYGGTGHDSLSSTGAFSSALVGGTSDDSLFSSGNSGMTLFGGGGSDLLFSSSDRSVELIGGSVVVTLFTSAGAPYTVLASGNDTLTASGDTSATLLAGNSNGDSLYNSGGSNVTLFGGSGDDTVGTAGGANVELAAGGGNNVYQVSGPSSQSAPIVLNDLATFADSQADTDSQLPGTNTITFGPGEFAASLNLANAGNGDAGTSLPVQQVTSDLWLALVGQFQNVVGTPGNDSISGNSGPNVLTGGSGNDTLMGGSGSATLVAGSGNDSLLAGSGGTTFEFKGSSFGSDTIDPPGGTDNTLDFSQFGGPVTLDLGSKSLQTVNEATGLSLLLKTNAGINGVVDSAFDDSVTGDAGNDRFYVGRGNDTFTGGGGSDTYFFSGSQLGHDQINEGGTFGGVTASSTNRLYFLEFGAPLDVNLNGTAGAPQITSTVGGKSWLSVSLSNPNAFNDVVGTRYGDTIQAGSGDVSLYGGGGHDSLVAGSGNAYLQSGVTQVVFLDFDHPASQSDVSYSDFGGEDLEGAIVERLQHDYADFNYEFTTDQAQAEQWATPFGGLYTTFKINQGPAGGQSNQLDFLNLDLGGVSTVNINSFLGYGGGLVTPTDTNIIQLTADIIAHELGHQSGLRHTDSFGPIGTGVASTVASGYFPGAQTSDASAPETPADVMASPASVGTTLNQAAQLTYLGERDAIKLAFNDSGVVVNQAGLPTASPPAGVEGKAFVTNAYQLGALPALAVPNTIEDPTNRDFGQPFYVKALDVSGSLSAANEQDFYAFQGLPDEVVNVLAISAADTLNPHPFFTELGLFDSAGDLLAYNLHDFESTDSSLVDVRLPVPAGETPNADGTYTYYIGIDAYSGVPQDITPESPGDYQLFLYTFTTPDFGVDPPTPPPVPGGATLMGKGGNDTFVGSSGNDYFTFQPGSAGQASVVAGSGQETLDLSQSPAEGYLPNPLPPNVKLLEPLNVGTNTVLGSSANPSVLNQPVTFTATVTAETGDAFPTGTVLFEDDGEILDTETLDGTTNQVTSTISALSQGTHPIQAVYVPTGDFAGSPSNVVEQQVNAYGIASQLVFMPQPSDTTAGSAINGPSGVVVLIEDSYGNVVADDHSLVTISIGSVMAAAGNATAGLIDSTTSVNATAGKATFTNLVLDQAGQYTLAASDNGLSGFASHSFNVTPAAFHQLFFPTAGQPTNTTAGSAINSTNGGVEVWIEDTYGNVLTNDNSQVVISIGSFTAAPGSAASGFINSTTGVNATAGEATFTNLVLDRAGQYTLAASDNGLTGFAPHSFSVTPAVASQLIFTTLPATATATQVVNSPAGIQVSIEDQYKNVETGDASTVSLHVASGPGTFAAGSITSAGAVAGVATFKNVALTLSGTYVLSATDSAGGLSGSGGVTVNPLDVTSQVSAVRSAFLYSYTTLTYVGTLAITNTSSGTINGALEVVLKGLPAGVTLAKVTLGSTTLSFGLDASGEPVIAIPTSVLASLTRNQKITLSLQFNNPSKVGITFNTQVLADAS